MPTTERPISLLSNISKIFEKFMHSKLYDFLNKFNCLYDLQFGFRNKHSTIHTLIDITETIREAIEKNDVACGVFVDLQKAFDTVNHEILLSKLNYYGIRGVPQKWFQSYLSNRFQFVNINGTNSTIKPINIGVPQGSILGPLLFLIYINDLHRCIKYSKTYHFADDTNLLIIDKSLKKLNKHLNADLSALVQWLRANKISLNTKKTELIIFKSRNKKISKTLNFRLSGQKLTPVNKIKYLGLIIDENLTFSQHLQDLSCKLSRSNGMLAKIRHFVNYETLLNIYHAIFGSHMGYGCQVWGQRNTEYIKRIMSIQNKSLKIMHFQNNRFKPSILYYLSKILTLPDLVKFKNCIFVWENLQNLSPNNFRLYFKLAYEIHNYTLRSVSSNKLAVPMKQTFQYGLYSITYQSIYFWNSLPNYLKVDKAKISKGVFSNSLK